MVRKIAPYMLSSQNAYFYHVEHVRLRSGYTPPKHLDGVQ